jgi:hypothetical protein
MKEAYRQAEGDRGGLPGRRRTDEVAPELVLLDWSLLQLPSTLRRSSGRTMCQSGSGALEETRAVPFVCGVRGPAIIVLATSLSPTAARKGIETQKSACALRLLSIKLFLYFEVRALTCLLKRLPRDRTECLSVWRELAGSLEVS